MDVYTNEQYQTLLAAKAQGALTVKYADKEVTYMSLDHMNSILKDMRDSLGLNGTNPANNGRRFASFSKGI